jgi:hypothetical protein
MAVDPAGPYRQPGLLMRDEHDLGRVFEALLTNALVHTEAGTPVRVTRGTNGSSKWPTMDPACPPGTPRGDGALVRG